MLHVALLVHVAWYSMKWYDCILYARSHCVESGVGAWYCYSPFLVNVR